MVTSWFMLQCSTSEPHHRAGLFAFGNIVLYIFGPGVNIPLRHHALVALSAVMVIEVDSSLSPFPFVSDTARAQHYTWHTACGETRSWAIQSSNPIFAIYLLGNLFMFISLNCMLELIIHTFKHFCENLR